MGVRPLFLVLVAHVSPGEFPCNNLDGLLLWLWFHFLENVLQVFVELRVLDFLFEILLVSVELLFGPWCVPPDLLLDKDEDVFGGVVLWASWWQVDDPFESDALHPFHQEGVLFQGGVVSGCWHCPISVLFL